MILFWGANSMFDEVLYLILGANSMVTTQTMSTRIRRYIYMFNARIKHNLQHAHTQLSILLYLNSIHHISENAIILGSFTLFLY